jgi:transposase
MEQTKQPRVKKARRHYEQFKVDAVRLLTESGGPLAEVARELGIGRSELKRWQKQWARSASPSVAFPGNGKAWVENKELEDLRKELARVKEEREILVFILKVMVGKTSSRPAVFA